MGNKPTKSQARSSLDPQAAYRMRVGMDFLRVDCRGEAGLIADIPQSAPDEHFTFHLTHRQTDEDTTDGHLKLLTTLRLRARRCGRTYYLAAGHNAHQRPYACRVSFQPVEGDDDDDGDDDGASSTWILTRLSGGRYALVSHQFRKYCLASVNGSLCLQTFSRARRSKQIAFYPIEDQAANRHRRSSTPRSDRSSTGLSLTSSSTGHSVAVMSNWSSTPSMPFRPGRVRRTSSSCSSDSSLASSRWSSLSR